MTASKGLPKKYATPAVKLLETERRGELRLAQDRDELFARTNDVFWKRRVSGHLSRAEAYGKAIEFLLGEKA